MPSPKVFKDPRSPFFHYRFRLGGVRIQRSTHETRPGRAQAVADEAWEVAKLRARGEEPEPTVAGLVRLWVEKHRLIKSPSHVEGVERMGQDHLGDLAGLRLQEVTTQQVEDARLAYLQDHAKSSANLWLSYLKLVFKWAIKRRMIKYVPWQVAPLKVQRAPKRLLPTARQVAFLGAVDRFCGEDPALALCIRIMMGLGLRGSEARCARWEWLDLDRRTYTPGETKGLEAWARPIPNWIVEILRPLARPQGPMLPSSRGGPITRQRIQRVIDAACMALDLARITGHRLRGTYATLLSEAGVPIQDIQRALGHKDSRTTMGYLEPSLDRIIQGQERIGLKTGLGGRKTAGRSAGDPHEP